jgi:hypothetical protein
MNSSLDKAWGSHCGVEPSPGMDKIQAIARHSGNPVLLTGRLFAVSAWHSDTKSPNRRICFAMRCAGNLINWIFSYYHKRDSSAFFIMLLFY